ncbi:MAG: pyridoxamine 5'-phosphate oxidase family protein [Candidatus Hermodarchaeota archaeon]|nr:pyridoxamine 5'-phosphate oxidase family protein [Candidatus Hermodarchaeota archaeon]
MSKSKQEMSSAEIAQFLTCARVGRLGLCINNEPYIIPLGFVYHKGQIAFHSCVEGIKMKTLEHNPRVCFEVDETLSDASMYKSVIIYGVAKILSDPAKMIPWLQLHIDKYRVSEDFDTYMQKPGRDRDAELAKSRIVVIKPDSVSGRKFIRSLS